MKYTIKINKMEYIAFSQTLCLFPLLVDYLVSASCRVIGMSTDYLRVVAYLIYLLVLVPAIMMAVNRKVRLKSLVFPWIIMFSMIGPFFNNSMVFSEYSDNFYYLFIMCIPTYMLFSLEFDIRYLMKYVTIFSYVAGIFFTLIYFVNSFVVKIMNTTNYQTMSYAFLFPIIFLSQKKEKSTGDKVLIGSMILLQFFAGGRASIFCLGIFYIVMLIRLGKKNIMWIVFLALFIVIAVSYFDLFALWVTNVCEKYNIHGGIASYLSRGDVFSDSNRFLIYKDSINAFIRKPWFGYGILGDRYAISTSVYPHNIVLEFLLHYGALFTIMFFAWFISKFAIMVKYMNKDAVQIMLAIFFSTGFLVLMFSTSYVLRPDFFALIAVLSHSKSFYKNSNKLVESYEEI